MSFNSSHVRQMRAAKNSQARVSKYTSGGMSPFVEPYQLQDGVYRARIWPADPIKNPLGYLFYRSHKILDQDAPPLSWQCPRSSNWDPMPTHWVDEEGNQFQGDAVDIETMRPEFKERCWGCEIEEQFSQLGLELSDCTERLAKWMKALLGDGKYHFPATITAEVFSKTVRKDEETGKEYTDIDYNAKSDARMHCLFGMKDNMSLASDLLTLIEECPDCSDLQFGRWLILTKKNEGKGVGGYNLRFETHPSPAGFELGNYPNLATWGKGNAAFKKPSKRVSYSSVEAVGSAPGKWWCQELAKLKVVLSDEIAIPF